MDTTLLLGLVALGLALPGLLVQRFGPLGVRVAALIALAAVWYAAMDWPRSEHESVPPRVVAVTTGDTLPPELVALEASLKAASGSLEVLRGDLSQNLAIASLRPGVTSDDLILVWTDSFLPSPADTAVVSGVRAYSTTAAPAIEPLDFELRSFVRFEVGRPAGLELRFVGEDFNPNESSWQGVVHVRSADVAVTEHAFVAADFVEPIRFEFELTKAGLYEVDLVVDLGGGSSIKAQAQFEARAPRPILLVGSDTAAIARALEVQGIASEELTALPAELEPVRTVVLLSRVDVAEQQRLVRFVDDGGGLFLVGGEDLGALPAPGEPLAELVPVTVLPPEIKPENSGDGSSGGDDPETAEPEIVPPKPDPPEEDPEKPELPKPDDKPEAPATGDVSTTTLPPTKEKEIVDRRHVALVLIVDRSGSMEQGGSLQFGRTPMDYARTAAFETASQLRPEDHLGVVSFGNGSTEVIPLGPVPAIDRLRKLLSKLEAKNESTQLQFGLDHARRMLGKSKLAIRHAVVITDAQFLGSELPGYQSRARRMAAEGITVSMIHLPGNSPVVKIQVKRIARFGKGQYILATDASKIPRLLLAEVQRVSGVGGDPGADPLAKAEPEKKSEPEKKPDPEPAEPPEKDSETEDPPEPAEKPDPDPMPSEAEPRELRVRAVADSPLVEPRPGSVDHPEMKDYPALAGIAPVLGRSDARVLLVAGKSGTPLLAFANRGLGRIGAWTSDFVGPWGRAWREDPSFPGRLGAWVEHLKPAELIDESQDLLVDRRLSPPAPLRAERDAMLTLALGPLAPLSSFVPPTGHQVDREFGMGSEDAIFALISLLFLLIVEWSLRRFSGKLTTKPRAS